MDLPETEHISLRLEQRVLHLTLDRPERRNAMSFQMVEEIEAALASVREHVESVRVVVIRGSGGHFCAGGDIKDMAASRGAEPGPDGRDPMAVANRRFGTLLQAVEAAPQPVLMVCEGAVMGGGFGLACVGDITFALEGARFRLPETGLGITPAQVMPFIVRRIGLTQARRLAVTGSTLSAEQSVNVGLAHEYCATQAGLETALQETLQQVFRCAPRATAATKQLALRVGTAPLDTLLDRAADEFAQLGRGDEAMAGMMAFLSKQPPPWATPEPSEDTQENP